ncbi:hypothetical protein NC651_034591 [Populus alba x Populus x berolinensis]|nr:hypothetical protein NC651_034591 [Populus alba x Populus x berolinensis]
MSALRKNFSGLITEALMTLVHGLETKFDAEMAAMTRVPWATLEIVCEWHKYDPLKQHSSTRKTSFTDTFPLASSLGPRFFATIFKCKQISETGAQQMLLDTQAVKTILLEVPSLGRQTSSSASYSKFVSREMSKAEALLKVILSPVDSVADTYRALLPEGTPMEFQRILELKISRLYLTTSTSTALQLTQPSIAPSDTPAAPPVPASPAIANSTAGFIASREDVLTRAAALGRGAATTGFKRFLALTEAAKDRKDGPFRKLFNA